ncbi:MAG: holo-ACP synthase [Gemmatimonadetes bacterium]|nr:holo-ACP synthase [Gemmatimonadota bacterium]
MTILGVGLDLVAVQRVERLLQRYGRRALERLLTEAERTYCEEQPVPARHVAVRLAAKEAAYKAFQGATHARGIGWRQLEVARLSDGRPELLLHGHAEVVARSLGVSEIFLSLSHTDDHAAAIVVLAGADKSD